MTDFRNRIIEQRLVDAADLKPHPLNARRHPENQKRAVAGLLSEVGIVDSLTVYESAEYGGLVVLDGHLRKDMGGMWPVNVLNIDDDEAALLLSVFDYTASLAELDGAALAELLARVEMTPVEDDGVRELLAMLAAANVVEVAKTDVDAEPQVNRAVELQQVWGTATGQLWQLGEHRLICGDCTDAAVVARVMGGEKARTVVTSPPYADQRTYQIGEFDWLALANGMFDALPIGSPCDILINLGLSYKDGKVNAYWQPWLDHCSQVGHPLYGWYVWDKGSGFPGEWNGRLAPAHEWVFHFSIARESANKWIKTTGESAKRGTSGKLFRQKDGSMNEVTSPDKIGQPYKIPDSVIRVGREMARGIHTEAHPAVFSEEFAEFMIQTWSIACDVVYEPFSGSGTTIIACEQLGRKCRAIEVSPGYVGVALQRYFDATSKQPTLLEAA